MYFCKTWNIFYTIHIVDSAKARPASVDYNHDSAGPVLSLVQSLSHCHASRLACPRMKGAMDSATAARHTANLEWLFEHYYGCGSLSGARSNWLCPAHSMHLQKNILAAGSAEETPQQLFEKQEASIFSTGKGERSVDFKEKNMCVARVQLRRDTADSNCGRGNRGCWQDGMHAAFPSHELWFS